MFKNKKELAMALMDGRRFKTMSGNVLFYDETINENPFRYLYSNDGLSEAM